MNTFPSEFQRIVYQTSRDRLTPGVVTIPVGSPSVQLCDIGSVCVLQGSQQHVRKCALAGALFSWFGPDSVWIKVPFYVFFPTRAVATRGKAGMWIFEVQLSKSQWVRWIASPDELEVAFQALGEARAAENVASTVEAAAAEEQWPRRVCTFGCWLFDELADGSLRMAVEVIPDKSFVRLFAPADRAALRDEWLQMLVTCRDNLLNAFDD
jgi:hypothetical protein